MPRKKYAPTDRDKGRVEAMTAYGADQETIAREIGCDTKTLRRYFRDELDMGKPRANLKVVQSLYGKATGDGPQSVTAAIFWCKTQLGWKDRVDVQHTGANGGPIEFTFSLDHAEPADDFE